MASPVTVIICTRDRPHQLEACLNSLAAQRYQEFEILVVDNGITHSTGEVCRALGIAVIRERVPGLTRARNLGARAARGGLVAYLDDDAIAEPQWLEALVREFDDPRVAAVAGRTLYMQAVPGSLAMTSVEATGEVDPRPRRSFDNTARDWFGSACCGGIGDGNTMMFRRSTLTSSVRFDERIGRGRLIGGGDEHVAFMSVIADGHRVVHAPDAVVRHPVPADRASRRAKRMCDLQESVAYLLFLFREFPAHRAALARFLVGRLLWSGPRTTGRATEGLSARQTIGAVARGVRTYFAAAREWSAPPATEAPAARVVAR
jgi:glycosyltransferase involved in cell wall biosynthesis